MRVLNHSSQRASFSPVAKLIGGMRPAVIATATPHFSIFAMPALGPEGSVIANAVQARCESDYQVLCDYFGLQIPHFNVILSPLSTLMDGTGGAFHSSCKSADLYCDVKMTPTIVPAVSSSLAVAEAVEVFEAVQDKGWDCGASNGEGLSRVLADDLYPGILDDGYYTAKKWLNSLRGNWVDVTKNSDTDPLANGCACLFLNWMRFKLGKSWQEICQAGGDNLGETYRRVTGKDDGWDAFNDEIDNGLGLPPDSDPQFAGDNPWRT